MRFHKLIIFLITLLIPILFLSCATTNLIKNPSVELQKALNSYAVIAFSPKYNFNTTTGKFTIILKLYDYNSSINKELYITSFYPPANNEQLFYFKLKPGRYGLKAINHGISSDDVNLMTNMMTTGKALPKYHWKMTYTFKNVDDVNIEAGKVYYIGDYILDCSLTGSGSSDEYWTGKQLRIENKFGLRKKEIIKYYSISGENIVKKLNLLIDFNKFQYEIL